MFQANNTISLNKSIELLHLEKINQNKFYRAMRVDEAELWKKKRSSSYFVNNRERYEIQWRTNTNKYIPYIYSIFWKLLEIIRKAKYLSELNMKNAIDKDNNKRSGKLNTTLYTNTYTLTTHKNITLTLAYVIWTFWTSWNHFHWHSFQC